MDKVFYMLGIAYFIIEMEIGDQWWLWTSISVYFAIKGLLKLADMSQAQTRKKEKVHRQELTSLLEAQKLYKQANKGASGG